MKTVTVELRRDDALQLLRSMEENNIIRLINSRIADSENKPQYDEPQNEKIKENIRKGLAELQQIEDGNLTTRSAKEFLDEL